MDIEQFGCIYSGSCYSLISEIRVVVLKSRSSCKFYTCNYNKYDLKTNLSGIMISDGLHQHHSVSQWMHVTYTNYWNYWYSQQVIFILTSVKQVCTTCSLAISICISCKSIFLHLYYVLGGHPEWVWTSRPSPIFPNGKPPGFHVVGENIGLTRIPPLWLGGSKVVVCTRNQVLGRWSIEYYTGLKEA